MMHNDKNCWHYWEAKGIARWCRCSLIHDMTYLWTCIRVSWVDQRHYSPITIIGCWCGLVVVHAFPLAKSQDEQAMSWACCSPASWGGYVVPQGTAVPLKWHVPILPMPFKQGVSSSILGSFGGSSSFQQMITWNKAWNGQLLRKALLFHSNGKSLLPMPFEQGASSSIFGCFGQIITQTRPAIVSFYGRRAT